MKKRILTLAMMALMLGSCGTNSTSTSTSENKGSTETQTSTKATDTGTSVAPSDGTTTYVFEAEYNPDIETMTGAAFSGTYTGLDMIQNDTKNGDYQASNGYYVTGLCTPGQLLTFTINSDKDVSNCTFIMRISSEAYNITLKPNFYDIYVNNETINYKEISLSDVPGYQQGFKAFEDYTLTTKLKLKKGENTIAFYTNNSTKLGGTFSATAPMLDCFKIKTDATLTWEPSTENLENK